MTSPVKQDKIVMAPTQGRSMETAVVGFMHTFMTLIIALTAAYLANS